VTPFLRTFHCYENFGLERGRINSSRASKMILTSDSLIIVLGVGTVIRGSTIIYATNNLIVYFPFYTCSFLTIPFATGYRTGQAIALMIALDRFVAVWKPLSYNKLQSSVRIGFVGR
jgi:hypothetical protein